MVLLFAPPYQPVTQPRRQAPIQTTQAPRPVDQMRIAPGQGPIQTQNMPQQPRQAPVERAPLAPPAWPAQPPQRPIGFVNPGGPFSGGYTPGEPVARPVQPVTLPQPQAAIPARLSPFLRGNSNPVAIALAQRLLGRQFNTDGGAPIEWR